MHNPIAERRPASKRETMKQVAKNLLARPFVAVIKTTLVMPVRGISTKGAA
jgi:hypothetical protein